MSVIIYKKVVEIPDSVELSVKENTITAKGPKGEVKKTFRPSNVIMEIKEKNFHISASFPNKRLKAMVGTIAGITKNLIKGVEDGFIVKLKIIFSHFPIEAKYDKKSRIFEYTNHYGQKVIKKIPIPETVECKIEGEDIILSGPSIELVTQAGAVIEQSCRLRGKRAKDSRIFQDGIYRYESS